MVEDGVDDRVQRRVHVAQPRRQDEERHRRLLGRIGGNTGLEPKWSLILPNIDTVNIGYFDKSLIVTLLPFLNGVRNPIFTLL